MITTGISSKGKLLDAQEISAPLRVHVPRSESRLRLTSGNRSTHWPKGSLTLAAAESDVAIGKAGFVADASAAA